MARELKLITWCDGEHEEDVPASTARTVSVDGGKPVLLDLCETCDKVVQDMVTFMERGVLASKAVGVPATQARRADALPTRVGVRRRARRSGADRTDCPECDYDGPTRGALGSHVKTAHGKRIKDYDWTVS